MEPGKYSSKIIDYGIGKSKADKPYIFVKFQIPSNETITWFGNLSAGKATEITVDSLLKMGLKGNDLAILADGLEAKALSTSKEFEIVVENDEYQGKTKLRVKYINVPGENGGAERFSKHEAVQKLAGFKADVLARRQATQISEPKEETPVDTSDIPF